MASSNRTLNSLGKFLILLDDCCNAQISNWSDLLSAIYGNSGSGVNALGGVHCPKLKGDSPYIGCSLYDKDAEVTVLSYKQMVDAGRVYHDKSENSFYLTFPTSPDAKKAIVDRGSVAKLTQLCSLTIKQLMAMARSCNEGC